MSPSRAPIGRVEWTRWVAAMACRCGRSTHGDNYAPRSDVQGSTPPPRRRRGACESSQVFQLVACARPAAAASRARPDPDIRLGSGMVIRRESVPPSGQARRGLRPRVRLTCLGLPDPPYWGGSFRVGSFLAKPSLGRASSARACWKEAAFPARKQRTHRLRLPQASCVAACCSSSPIAPHKLQPS